MLGLFGIVCVLLWALFVNYLREKCTYSKCFGKVKKVQFFKTSKQYKTLLVVKSEFENRVKGGEPGKVIGRLSAIVPEQHLKKHLNYNPETVVEEDGAHVEILYLDYAITNLLLEALQDCFPEGNVELAIKPSEIDDQPLREEREYVLLDISNFASPDHQKAVSNDDFLLIYCQNIKFSLQIKETILDNVQAYIKITSNMLNRPITEMHDNNKLIKNSRLYAYKLEGYDDNDETILKWVDTDAFCR